MIAGEEKKNSTLAAWNFPDKLIIGTFLDALHYHIPARGETKYASRLRRHSIIDAGQRSWKVFSLLPRKRTQAVADRAIVQFRYT